MIKSKNIPTKFQLIQNRDNYNMISDPYKVLLEKSEMTKEEKLI